MTALRKTVRKRRTDMAGTLRLQREGRENLTAWGHLFVGSTSAADVMSEAVRHPGVTFVRVGPRRSPVIAVAMGVARGLWPVSGRAVSRGAHEMRFGTIGAVTAQIAQLAT